MAAAASPVPTSPAPDPTPRITLEQYLRTSYKPDCDFVDGVLEKRNSGEKTHSQLQAFVAAWFVNHRRDWKIQVLVEQRTRVAGKQVRIVDVCLLRIGAPNEEVTITPPLLCIEILSPEDRLSRARRVLEDYRAMGVSQSWLIDPIYHSAYVFDANGLRLLESTERVELTGTPIYLPLDELFSELD